MVRKHDVGTEGLRARIQERLDSLGKNPRGASLEAGLGASTIRNILEGRSGSPRVDTLTAIARVLQVSPNWLLEDIVQEEGGERTALTDMNTLLLSDTLATKGIRLEKGEGRFENSLFLFAPDVTEDGIFIITPTFMSVSLEAFSLPDAKDIFAFIVKDRSMEPAYFLDDIVVVSRVLPIMKNYEYIFKDTKTSDKTTGVFVFGRLLAVEAENYVVQQHCPSRTFAIKIKDYGEA